ncbi:MAG: M14 family zinc carboxypeptidase [Gammaproteobacteria bacterium]
MNRLLVRALLVSLLSAAVQSHAETGPTLTEAGMYSPVVNGPHHTPVPDHTVSLLWALDEVSRLCQQIDEKLTSIDYDECVDANLVPSGAYSSLHRSIAYKDVVPTDVETTGRVLLIGGIHGDEYSSVTIVFRWLKELEAKQGGRFHWRVVPTLNPDGLLMPPKKSQRMNANGVDLNRNFPTPNWEEEARDYWVNRTRKSKRRYPGTAPLSEPESRWLAAQIDEFAPDAVISVHAPHGIVDFDGPLVPPDNLGPLELRLLGTYPGSMGRYIGVYKGIPLLTVELESALRVPDKEDMETIWRDTIAWLENRVIVMPETGIENAQQSTQENTPEDADLPESANN